MAILIHISQVECYFMLNMQTFGYYPYILNSIIRAKLVTLQKVIIMYRSMRCCIFPPLTFMSTCFYTFPLLQFHQSKILWFFTCYTGKHNQRKKVDLGTLIPNLVTFANTFIKIPLVKKPNIYLLCDKIIPILRSDRNFYCFITL